MGSKANNQKIKYKGRMTVENLIIIRKWTRWGRL
jgi:hypothetical protein